MSKSNSIKKHKSGSATAKAKQHISEAKETKKFMTVLAVVTLLLVILLYVIFVGFN